jgi:hypothetical protein
VLRWERLLNSSLPNDALNLRAAQKDVKAQAGEVADDDGAAGGMDSADVMVWPRMRRLRTS